MGYTVSHFRMQSNGATRASGPSLLPGPPLPQDRAKAHCAGPEPAPPKTERPRHTRETSQHAWMGTALLVLPQLIAG